MTRVFCKVAGKLCIWDAETKDHAEAIYQVARQGVPFGEKRSAILALVHPRAAYTKLNEK